MGVQINFDIVMFQYFSLVFVLFRVLFKISFIIWNHKKIVLFILVTPIIQMLTILPLSSIFTHLFFFYPSPMSSQINPFLYLLQESPNLHLTNSVSYYKSFVIQPLLVLFYFFISKCSPQYLHDFFKISVLFHVEYFSLSVEYVYDVHFKYFVLSVALVLLYKEIIFLPVIFTV